MTASGLWVNRAGHDLIVYEENTRPEHQLVIIGHEAWHMLHGHCATTHPHTAHRADHTGTTGALDQLAARLSETTGDDTPEAEATDAALHYAARTDTRARQEEVDAERFGFFFATDVQAALDEAHSTPHAHGLPARLQHSMAHRFKRP
ncbi:hypothetical protein [Streptomyces sp. NPDC003717]|uniref:hypothetical protein n=1 Tax=Streptomyces sp. NPDC003717 TaxID=3154276 RepID=UPI0033B97C76